jgi:hypothetical protein
VEVEIFNVKGQIIEKIAYSAKKGRNKVEYSFDDNQPKGFYFYRIKTNQSVLSGKILKQ